MEDYTFKKLPLEQKFESPEILNLTIIANEKLAELDRVILQIPNFDLVLQPLTIREAVASSEIENIRTTTIEMLQAELISPKTLTSGQKEVLNYKKSLLTGFELIQRKSIFTAEDLIVMHSLIVPEKPGVRNKGTVCIGNRLGKIIYMPPKNLKDINNYITNLFEYISSKVSNSLVKIILSHYQLEAIHPFFDGNGRVGRVLMSLQLVMERKLQYPILFISGYILQNKSTYYELFREIQEKGNWNDWIIFHLNGISNQASEVILRVKEINILHKKFVIEIDKLLKISKMKLESIENYFFIQAFYTQTNMAKV